MPTTNENDSSSAATNHYDAILFLSFGGPEGHDDVMPFLENVTRGRNIPHERLLEVAEHYHHFGGVSPINAQNRDLIAAIEKELASHNIKLPIYFGNRNWHPFLTDTLKKMQQDGVKRALTFITSAFSSYSGCRQYREDIEKSQKELNGEAPQCDKIRVFYNHPGFIEPVTRNIQAAIADVGAPDPTLVKVLFTAHSIPMAMANGGNYVKQLQEACKLVAERIPTANWELVYQSRSGPPSVPWLEPDVCDRLRQLASEGVKYVVIMPIGFISDHMEVLYDLDTEAVDVCKEIGIEMRRAATVGVDPQFVSMIRELIEERVSGIDRRALGCLGPSHDVCPVGCCPSGRPAGAGRPNPQPQQS